jgi:hypothetical protein
MKQTAVEYLLEEFSAIIGRVNFTVTQDLFIRDAVIKAKEMEKEQIIKAYKDGRSDLASNFHKSLNMSLEQYYNETYKNEIK